MKNKTYTATLKQPYELQNDFDGEFENRRVILVFHNGEEYHGVFRGMDGESTIMLRSDGKSPTTIGLPFHALKFWLLNDN